MVGTGCEGTRAAGSPCPPWQAPLPSRHGEAHRTPLWAHPSRPRSHPLHHTSSAPGYSGPSPCSGTRPPRRSSGLQAGGRGEEEGFFQEHAVRVGSGWEWPPRGSRRPCAGSVGSGRLTAVGGLIAAVHTVVVPVTHPDPGDAALGDGALELVGGTGHLGCGVGDRVRTCPLCLSPQFSSTSSLSPPSPGLVLVLPAISCRRDSLFLTLVIFVFGICTSL